MSCKKTQNLLKKGITEKQLQVHSGEQNKEFVGGGATGHVVTVVTQF